MTNPKPTFLLETKNIYLRSFGDKKNQKLVCDIKMTSHLQTHNPPPPSPPLLLHLFQLPLPPNKESKWSNHVECFLYFLVFVDVFPSAECAVALRPSAAAAPSEPHLSSKAAKRRASKMFSSGSQVLYL